MIEMIIVACIHDFAEFVSLLSETQMRTWQEQFTETAVTLLLIWIRAVWDSEEAVVLVLALYVSETFN